MTPFTSSQPQSRGSQRPLLQVVDEDDRLIGHRTFDDCHRLGLRHRSVNVFVFSDPTLREVLLFRRSGAVADPHTICTVGGHVDEGETYEQAAVRELKEEALNGAPLTPLVQRLGTLRNDRQDNREFSAIFSAVLAGPFSGDPEEVGEIVGFVPLDILRRELEITPGKYARDMPLLVTFLLSAIGKQGCPREGRARRRMPGQFI